MKDINIEIDLFKYENRFLSILKSVPLIRKYITNEDEEVLSKLTSIDVLDNDKNDNY